MVLLPEETMKEHQAIARMVPPGKFRPRKFRGGVIQVWVTRACENACIGCTQGSNLSGKPGMITPGQFEAALDSLKDYWGVVGVFGGNPTLHPEFDLLCEILRSKFPKVQCGLWASRLNGKGEACRQTFNPSCSNLNVHLNAEAYMEFKREWPECKPFGVKEDSRHSPPYVALQDLISNEEERWDLIADCDINKHWSAMLCVFRGELRAYFCEIAGAQAMLHQHDPRWPDTGLPAKEGWWRMGMPYFADQVRFHCHRCGIPFRGHGELAQNPYGVETTTMTHADVYTPKVPGREVKIVTGVDQLGSRLPNVIKYIENGKR